MATFLIVALQDNFADAIIGTAWANSNVQSGSATMAETGGLGTITLPSSTVGTHEARYSSSASYDFTGDGANIGINTMVSTAVAATAYWRLYIDNSNYYEWTQTSGTLKARKTVAAVATDLYSVAWSLSTYQYLRIRESGGTIYFDSSTSASAGAAWTNRATQTVAGAFAVTALFINFGAVCGNVASPGAFKLDSFNTPLPVPTATWRETTADWSITNRLRPVTLGSNGGKQGVLVTADTMDSSRNLGGTLHYYAAPIGSSSGGYLQLTEYTTLALAQAAAFTIPLNARLDLPAMVDARYMRLYHRSIDAVSHTIYEFVPRRIVQAEDIEAESISAINIAARAITSDKIFVLDLSAITANIGQLTITSATGAPAWIYQGTGTGTTPTTGLKIFNSGGIGKLSTYNTGVEQVTFDTDGKLKWGAGAGQMDAAGIRINALSAMADLRAYTFKGASASVGGLYGSEDAGGNQIRVWAIGGAATAGTVMFQASTASTVTASIDSFMASGVSTSRPFFASVNSSGTVVTELDAQGANGTIYLRSPIRATYGLNVGSATGAGTGEISTSGSVGIGNSVSSVIRAYVKGAGTTSGTYAIYAENSAATNEFYVRNDGVGFINAAAWVYSSDTSRKRNIRNLNKDIVDFMKLEPKLFDYIDGRANQYGYIAQDVQLIMPEIVMDVGDGSLGMMTDALLPLFNHVLRRLIRILVTKGVIGPADLA